LDRLTADIKDKKSKNELIPDKISTKYFFKIIELTNRKKIDFIVLNTPIHSSLVKKSIEDKKVYDQFMSELNSKIIFWDYENLKFEDKYFFDENHLNENGASLFSKIIDKQIKGLKEN
jgi:hypothetical protein